MCYVESDDVLFSFVFKVHTLLGREHREALVELEGCRKGPARRWAVAVVDRGPSSLGGRPRGWGLGPALGFLSGPASPVKGTNN